MAGPKQTAFYKGKAWRRTQQAYMRALVELRDGRVCPPLMCERCFEHRNELKPADFVHHIVHLDESNCSDPDIALNTDNLMRVCRDCHAELHYPGDYRPLVSFDAQGRVTRNDNHIYM